MQNTIFGDERTSAAQTPGSQHADKDATSSAKTTTQEARSRGAVANDDKSTERLPQQVGAGKLPRTVQKMGAAAQGASSSALDSKGRKGKETSEMNTERRNNLATLNSTGTASGGVPDSQVRESADASQKENENPKYRGAANGSSMATAPGQAGSPFQQCDSGQ